MELSYLVTQKVGLVVNLGVALSVQLDDLFDFVLIL